MVARIQLLFLVPALLIDLTKAITPGLIEKIRYTEEGEYLSDHLHISGISQEEQHLLPTTISTAFKLVLAGFNFTAGNTMHDPEGEEYSEAAEAVLAAVNLTVGLPIKRLQVVSITEYRGAGLLGKGVGRPVVFGFFQLENALVGKLAEEVLDDLKRNLTDKMLPDLPLLHGFAMNTLGVMEKDTVVHLAIQLWQEKCPYGLEDKNTNLGRNMTDVFLHLIQPKFRSIFGEHYYRTVISSMYCTSSDDSMVVQAYVLLDPSKENLYFSSTPWFSNEGWVKFGRWLLFPSNILVELGVLVPAQIHPYLSDRSYLAPLAPEFDQKGLFLSMTVPAILVLMGVIVSLILAFSLAHWLAYHNTVNKDKLFQERFQQI